MKLIPSTGWSLAHHDGEALICQLFHQSQNLDPTVEDFLAFCVRQAVRNNAVLAEVIDVDQNQSNSIWCFCRLGDFLLEAILEETPIEQAR